MPTVNALKLYSMLQTQLGQCERSLEVRYQAPFFTSKRRKIQTLKQRQSRKSNNVIARITHTSCHTYCTNVYMIRMKCSNFSSLQKLQLLILVNGLMPKCCYKYTEFKIFKVKCLQASEIPHIEVEKILQPVYFKALLDHVKNAL